MEKKVNKWVDKSFLIWAMLRPKNDWELKSYLTETMNDVFVNYNANILNYLLKFFKISIATVPIFSRTTGV